MKPHAQAWGDNYLARAWGECRMKNVEHRIEQQVCHALLYSIFYILHTAGISSYPRITFFTPPREKPKSICHRGTEARRRKVMVPEGGRLHFRALSISCFRGKNSSLSREKCDIQRIWISRARERVVPGIETTLTETKSFRMNQVHPKHPSM
jgi:hypothetical protein